MKIQAPKRILSEDFAQDERELASRLGNILNTYLDEIHQALSAKLNISDNLDQEIKTITVTVDASGNLITPVSFQNNLRSKIQGLIVIRAIGDTYPDGQPFISYIENNKVVSINNIKGLPANTQFQLVVLMITN